MLLAIGNEINSQVDLSSILNRLVDYARQLFNADHAANLRVQPDGRFVVDVRRNLSDEFVPTVEQYAHRRRSRRLGRHAACSSSTCRASSPRLEEAEVIAREGIVTISAAPICCRRRAGRRVGADA